MLAHTSDFVVGRDRLGRWTAVGSGGLAGGFFTSRKAALRYARLETGREQGAVRLSSAPLQLTLGEGQIGRQGEGLPAWWRLGPSTRGSKSYVDTFPIAASEDKRWFMLDIAMVAGLAMLCLAVGMIVS
jgi:hypothetical protein